MLIKSKNQLLKYCCIFASAASLALRASSANCQVRQQPAEPDGHITLAELEIFNSNDAKTAQSIKDDIANRIKAETGLEKAHPLPKKEKSKILEAFKNGQAGQYSVQQLIDAGVFQFSPIANLHPKSATGDDDKSIRLRDGRHLEIDNAYWGKGVLPTGIIYGVMHSTEDGTANAAKTIDMWNEDAAAGKRSSSTPFVLGRCVKGPEILATADFETRWQRHCSSKLTSIPGLVNWTSIGVEMEHSSEKKIDYTDEEIKYAARLWTYIQERAKFPDSCLITHGEIQGHLPKDHVSFRSDPEGFYWEKFGEEMRRLRKKSGFKPPAADPAAVKTKPQKAIEGSGDFLGD